MQVRVAVKESQDGKFHFVDIFGFLFFFAIRHRSNEVYLKAFTLLIYMYYFKTDWKRKM